MEKRIIMTEQELATALNNLTAKEGKIAAEQSKRFDEQSAKIQELTDAINNGGNVSLEVEAALANLEAATQSLDDSIPDAPEQPTT